MKILFIDKNDFSDFNNLKINFVNPKIEKIKNNLDKFGYGTFLKENNDYFLYMCTGELWIHKIKKYKLIDENNFEFIEEYNLNHAGHNFHAFYDKNNNIMGIGGESTMSNDKNIKFYDNNNNYINLCDKTICTNTFDKKCRNRKIRVKFISNPKQSNKNHMNGLHLFKYKSGKYENINNYLPIINGLHEGRKEGYYSFTNKKENRGFLVFDSISNVLYNKNKDEYYLYQRCNFERGCRLIHMSKSKDLINWDKFNLININSRNEEINFGNKRVNHYNPNFFKFNDCDYYFGILNREWYNHKFNSYSCPTMGLYFSKNGFDWKWYMNIKRFALKKTKENKHDLDHGCMICGKPVEINNKHIYYYNDNFKWGTDIIKKYIWDKFRYSYIINENETELASVNINIIKGSEDTLFLNMDLLDDYILDIKLLDNNEIKNSMIDFEYIEKKNLYKINFKEEDKKIEKNINLRIKFKNIRIYYLEII